MEVSSKEINVRSFKHMMEVVCNLSNFEFENLIQFLDHYNEGFIPIVDIQKHIL